MSVDLPQLRLEIFENGTIEAEVKSDRRAVEIRDALLWHGGVIKLISFCVVRWAVQGDDAPYRPSIGAGLC